MRDSLPGVDARVLREALLLLGERQALGVVITNAASVIVLATQRAKRILGTENGNQAVFEADLARLVEAVADGREDDATMRTTLRSSPHVVNVRATRLPNSSATSSAVATEQRYVLVVLSEEGPRGSLTKTLSAKFNLSARSIQLVQLASRGLKNKEIGIRMQLSEATIKTYMHTLFREVGVRNRAELVALADRLANGE